MWVRMPDGCGTYTSCARRCGKSGMRVRPPTGLRGSACGRIRRCEELWELVADEVRAMGGRVLLGVEASRFEVDDGFITLMACSDGRRFEADYVLSSMPIKDLVAGLPDAPDDVREVAEGLPYRDFVTVGILVPSLALKNETDTPTLGSVVPDNWIYVQDSGVKLGRIQVFNNWSPYLVADPEHTVWLGLEYFCAEGTSSGGRVTRTSRGRRRGS